MSGEVLDNLRQLHEAILADLREHYLDRVQTIEAYDPFPDADGQERAPLVTPALLIELDGIDPGEDDGTDRHPLRLSFVAHCVLSFRTAQMQLELREFASDVLQHVRHNRWGLYGAVQEPSALSAQAGEFQPGLQGFDSWQARWEQVVYVGLGAWAPEGTTPTTVYLGFAPHIGTAHEPEYIQVYPESGE